MKEKQNTVILVSFLWILESDRKCQGRVDQIRLLAFLKFLLRNMVTESMLFFKAKYVYNIPHCPQRILSQQFQCAKAYLLKSKLCHVHQNLMTNMQWIASSCKVDAMA